MSTPAITPELRQTLRRLKLSPLLETLPQRLELARQQNMSHAELLELVLADEIDRRDRHAAARRARAARLNPNMTLDAWDATTGVAYDRQLWNELATLRFTDDALNAFILGPVGVGKTHLAHALGHIACRRRLRVQADRADQLFKRLAASRLDGSHDAELRRLVGLDLLIIDDFALHSLDATATTDFYELVVQRHLRAATVVTSNREPPEWLAAMADPLLAQAALDRLQSAAYELVLEGESYRQRQKPTLNPSAKKEDR